MKHPSKGVMLIKLTFISICFLFGVFKLTTSFIIEHPSTDQPIVFFSPALNQDMEWLIHQVIAADHTPVYSLYSLKDPKLLKKFKSKKAIGRVHRKKYGLMHQKLLCVGDTLFVGTMNFSPSSLKMDRNFVVGIHSKTMTDKVRNAIKDNAYPDTIETTINHQHLHLRFLPEYKNSLEEILTKIEQAQHSIRIGMFYFSHPQIIDQIIAAHRRGVDVRVIAHYQTKQVQKLISNGLEVYLNNKEGLMHVKWMVIDDHTLYVGSTNWTKNAFQKNDECHLWLFPLSKLQQMQLKTCWDQWLITTKTPESY